MNISYISYCSVRFLLKKQTMPYLGLVVDHVGGHLLLPGVAGPPHVTIAYTPTKIPKNVFEDFAEEYKHDFEGQRVSFYALKCTQFEDTKKLPDGTKEKDAYGNEKKFLRIDVQLLLDWIPEEYIKTVRTKFKKFLVRNGFHGVKLIERPPHVTAHTILVDRNDKEAVDRAWKEHGESVGMWGKFVYGKPTVVYKEFCM
jgi:hypothetical protein